MTVSVSLSSVRLWIDLIIWSEFDQYQVSVCHSLTVSATNSIKDIDDVVSLLLFKLMVLFQVETPTQRETVLIMLANSRVRFWTWSSSNRSHFPVLINPILSCLRLDKFKNTCFSCQRNYSLKRVKLGPWTLFAGLLILWFVGSWVVAVCLSTAVCKL